MGHFGCKPSSIFKQHPFLHDNYMSFATPHWILIDDLEEKDSHIPFFPFCSEKLGHLGTDCSIIKWQYHVSALVWQKEQNLCSVLAPWTDQMYFTNCNKLCRVPLNCWRKQANLEQSVENVITPSIKKNSECTTEMLDYLRAVD